MCMSFLFNFSIQVEIVLQCFTFHKSLFSIYMTQNLNTRSTVNMKIQLKLFFFFFFFRIDESNTTTTQHNTTQPQHNNDNDKNNNNNNTTTNNINNNERLQL